MIIYFYENSRAQKRINYTFCPREVAKTKQTNYAQRPRRVHSAGNNSISRRRNYYFVKAIFFLEKRVKVQESRLAKKESKRGPRFLPNSYRIFIKRWNNGCKSFGS
jgi:hypothetical protein